ncbi:hypothetical protein JW960_22265 [candidate division KSB1 bacterium]|nr:hypothetical protein [candidate division KSB1 bacterium]
MKIWLCDFNSEFRNIITAFDIGSDDAGRVNKLLDKLRIKLYLNSLKVEVDTNWKERLLNILNGHV